MAVFQNQPESASQHSERQHRANNVRYRVGAVPYLAARPLVYGLDTSHEIEVIRLLPSHQRQMLVSSSLDAAFLPVVDLARLGRNLCILPAGCLAASGPTLISKVFSQVRPEELNLLWVDNSSHAAVALVQVLWACLYHRRISLIPFDSAHNSPPPDAQAVLLIGDKVVSEPPIGFEWHFDPTALWHEMTGLPFVFGVWAAMRDHNLADLYRILADARSQGQQHLTEIAEQYAQAYDWPLDLAIRSLSQELEFEFNDSHREGISEFLQLAFECNLVGQCKDLHYYQP